MSPNYCKLAQVINFFPKQQANAVIVFTNTLFNSMITH